MRSSFIVLSLFLGSATSAIAQPAAVDEPAVGPTSANPGGADAPAEIVRTPEAEAPVVVVEPAKAEAPAVEAPPEAAPAKVAASAAVPAVEVRGDELEGKIPATLRVSGQASTPFRVDGEGTELSPWPLETRLRIEPEMRYGAYRFAADLETSSGAISGLPSSELVGERTAHPALTALELRQLFLEYKGKTWVLRAGQQASNWGLGLVANSGARDPEPGEGFGDARYVDSTYRVLLAGRPLYGLGGTWRALESVVAADLVVRDDTANYWDGDRALQGVLALRFAPDPDRSLGIYTVLRRQRLADPADLRGTDAVVVDLAGKWSWSRGRGRAYSAGFEVVSISGTSSMAQSDTAPMQQIRQFGAVLKTSVTVKSLQLFLDGGYASGDQNPFDDKLEAFRFDPNFHVGLVLFDEVLGFQTARASLRASNPELVGRPPDGVDLLPTRGSVTGAAYLFPRARYALSDSFDLYGGPLFAFSTAKLTDPYATRVGGGEVVNALGGAPGNYLGTELDVGAQARFKPHPAVVLTTTFEAGVLFPGSAFVDASGNVMAPVGIGRLRLGVDL